MRYPVRVRIDPTFGHDITRIRGKSGATSGELNFTRVFSLTLPLTLSSDPVSIDSSGTPYVTFDADSTAACTKHEATSVTKTTRKLLFESGDVETSVDSLSRSVIQQPAAVDTLLEQLEAHTGVTQGVISTIEEALIVPKLADSTSVTGAEQLAETVATLTTSHENRHLKDLIDPKTAYWKELELLWHLQQILAAPTILESPGLVNRFAVLYALPRHVVTELNAIVAERSSIDNYELDPALYARLTADRGLEQQVWNYFQERGVDSDSIEELITHPIAQQFGDLWIVYIVSHLQQGHSLTELSGNAFLEKIGVERPDELIGVSAQPELAIDEIRDTFTELVLNQLYGPAFEVISLKTTPENNFELSRIWYNSNPTTTGSGHRLAVRRALFTRYFLAEFRVRTQLLAVRERITDAIAAGLEGTPVSLSAPVVDVDTDRVATTLETCLDAAYTNLDGINSRKELAQWLNDPSYDPLSHS